MLADWTVERFIDALSKDVYPMEEYEGIFGVRGDDKSSPMINVEMPWLPTKRMPLGRIVYCAWMTIYKNGQLNRQQVVQALYNYSLPQWYEAKIRNNGNPLSYYSKALIDGNLFGQIDWDSLMHQRFAIHSKSHYDSGKKQNENKEEFDLNKCAFCDEKFTNKRSKCGRCQKVAYCDRNCQVNHWKQHKMTCKK